MRLRTKLLLLSFVLLSVPAIIVVLVSGSELIKREQDLKRLSLKAVRLELNRELESFESDFRKDTVMVANLDYVRGFLGAATARMTPDLLATKLENLVLRSQVDSLALYSSSPSGFKRTLVIGDNRDIPMSLGNELGSDAVDRVVYRTEVSDVRATMIFPVVLYGRIVGLALLRRIFDSGWFAAFAYSHGVELGIRKDGSFLFSSSPAIGSIPASRLDAGILDSFSFESSHDRYLGTSTLVFSGQEGTASAELVVKAGKMLIEDRRTTAILGGILLFCITFPAAVLYFVGLRIISSLASVADAAGSLSRGDLAYRIKSKRNDEIGELYESFNDMALQLEAKEFSLNERNRKLALLNAYIGAVFQDLLVSCVAVDADGRVALANTSASLELNFPTDAAGGDLYSIPFFGRHRQIVERLIPRQDAESGGKARSDPVEVEDAETGKAYTLDVFPAPLDGERGGAIIVIVDVTEQRALENALVRNEKLAAAGQVASALAHDIYNPMSVLLSHIQLLSTNRLPPAEASRFLSRMEAEARRIIRLFERLLGIVKADAYQEAWTEVNAIVRDMLDVFDIKFKHRGITASLIEEVGSLQVRTSPEGLKQVLFNVINNAVQSIERPDGSIVARIGIREGEAVIELRDNGRGIAPEDLERVFEPLRPRGHGSGTGLGLYMSRRIMRNLGGDLRASSSPGIGSCFTVSFRTGGILGAA